MGDTKQTRAALGFPTTRWSLVLAAAGGEADPDAHTRQALEELCGIYWRPVYSFARARGENREDAEDLTQGFIASLFERGTFADADQELGKMRSFLRVAFKRFMINQHERSNAQKRGGRMLAMPLDVDGLEDRLRDAKAEDPERAFDQHWALALLDDVLRKLGEEYASAGKGDQFSILRETLSADGEHLSRAELASRLKMTDGSLRVVVFRLRRRYRELLRGAIAKTVTSESEIDGEIEYLMTLFGSGV